MKAELVPENGDPPIPMVKDVTVIGRRGYCDVVIDDPSLSKRHCVIVKTDGLLVIRDLATTNGTKVKGQKIRWAALLPDDRVTLGGYKVRVYLGPDDMPAPSELSASPRKTVRQAAPPVAAGKPVRGGRPTPELGFASPSPLAVPAIGHVPTVNDSNSDDDSGWRKLISIRPRDADDVVIELE
jgi:predicted component of type VI protein secretion system